MSTPIRFYFDLVSTYSYLALRRIDDLAARYGREVDWIAVSLGHIFQSLDVKPPRLFDGNRNPGFKAHMQLKDLKIVMETAKEYDIPISGTKANTELFQQMIDLGMGELDNSAVVGVIEKLAGVEILD